MSEIDSMIEPAYYIIKGTDKLNALLASKDPSLKTLLADTGVWAQDEGGWSNLWQPEDRIIEVKIFFLIDLLERFENSHHSEMRSVIDQIFANPPFGVETFDQWWEIEKARIIGTSGLIVKYAEKRTLLRLGSTNSPVDDFINDLINHKPD